MTNLMRRPEYYFTPNVLVQTEPRSSSLQAEVMSFTIPFDPVFLVSDQEPRVQRVHTAAVGLEWEFKRASDDERWLRSRYVVTPKSRDLAQK